MAFYPPMLLSLQLKLTSAFLGNKNTRERVRCFNRTWDGAIELDRSQWLWTFQEAADAFKWRDIDCSAIRVDMIVRNPPVVRYVRRFRQGEDARKGSENFEAISEGKILTFNVLILQVSESPDKRPPNLEEFRAMLELVGQMIGISPWGSKFEYGRFEVLSINELESLTPLPPIVRYKHHDNDVSAQRHLKGRHKEHCLCHQGCKFFKPGEPDNCPIAQSIYTSCIDHGTVTPVFECPVYKPK